jgi:hypothetical protein
VNDFNYKIDNNANLCPYYIISTFSIIFKSLSIKIYK